LIEGGHTVATTWYQVWSGLKNGALLTVAEEARFDLFITADQELSHQQNLKNRANGSSSGENSSLAGGIAR